jgi:hypothetical protein
MTAVQPPSSADFFNLLAKEAARKAACAAAQKEYEQACSEEAQARAAFHSAGKEYHAAMAEALKSFAKDDSDLTRNAIIEKLSLPAKKYHEAFSVHRKAELKRRDFLATSRARGEFDANQAIADLMYAYLGFEGLPGAGHYFIP